MRNYDLGFFREENKFDKRTKTSWLNYLDNKDNFGHAESAA